VKVAVVDQGIQLDHPDLKSNISSISFDTATGTSPSQVRGDHGTACAGIIAATRGGNNTRGVAGVAPDATLISVSDSLMLGPNAAQNLATGITWAAQNGADVISNSWGHDQLESPLIDDAIEAALTQGRGGKGCVVVFAAGNHNGAILYPARSNPAILVVGAMSPCGQRKSPTSCDPEPFWGSCFGSTLDVVAPGVLIPTTDRTGADGYDSGDYTLGFNGTSSATPHAAGVAALILETNPGLTQQEVVSIIGRCARRVGPYSYQPTAGRPNGDWHQEMGYGLLDAKACVQAARQARVGN
jgi:subtilisin family serine protease